ncbi:MAG: family 16 glycosylhydrolase [Bacteroidota bacterium]
MKFGRPTLLSLFLTLIVACGETSAEMPNPTTSAVEISITNATIIEGAGASTMEFDLIASAMVEETITVQYAVSGITAEPNVDFDASSGTVDIPVGARRATISVPIINDEQNEVEEKIKVELISATNASLKNKEAIGIIRDNDDPIYDQSGYATSLTHFGYALEWADEFEGTTLNDEDYNYDLGDGCPNLCGWGNNELQLYTQENENISVVDGALTITATKQGTSDYYSAKIHTKDKKRFQYGRLDIRAKLPEGQGIWPAIWMLGQNIDEVGWPACGEIDIMELVGHEPKTTHGTAHWGPQGGPNKFKGKSYTIDRKFSERFHVFSLVWEPSEITWYVDEERIHRITPQDMEGQTYRFNQPFYLIFNIAVGGNWPGSPDNTTVFPQKMDIDYVRYFK